MRETIAQLDGNPASLGSKHRAPTTDPALVQHRAGSATIATLPRGVETAGQAAEFSVLAGARPDFTGGQMFESADDLLAYVKQEDVEIIDIRFCDLPGIMQHFTVPAGSFDKSVFEDGLAFDGSSIRGFQKIHESDMALLPDHATAYLDPFRVAKTLCINFFVHDPLTKEPYSRDPRNIARKAEAYLASTGIGDTAFFAPEAEFYVFDDVRFETKQNTGYYSIDSVAGAWNTGRVEEGGNRGYKVRYKGGYFPVPPVDHFADLRDEMVKNLEASGLIVERAHHEVGTAGQAEINYRFNTMLSAGDDLQKFKYIIKNTAWAAARPRPSCPSRSSATTGPACTSTPRCGRAATPCSTTRPGTADCPISPAGTSVASSPTPRRCWRSPTRP